MMMETSIVQRERGEGGGRRGEREGGGGEKGNEEMLLSNDSRCPCAAVVGKETNSQTLGDSLVAQWF